MDIEAKIAITATIVFVVSVFLTPQYHCRQHSICAFTGLASLAVLVIDLLYWVWN